MTTVFVFDYDLTLCTHTKTPSVKSFRKLTNSIKEACGVPMIIFTAGSVNSIDSTPSKKGEDVDRPYEFITNDCNLSCSINEFRTDVDVCCFGQYMTETRGDSHVAKSQYIKAGSNVYRPYTTVGKYSYEMLNTNCIKKMSTIYHTLLKFGINGQIVFIDDMHYHDFSGLEGMIVDPFESIESTYYQIYPLRTQMEATQRVTDMSKAIETDTIGDYLKGKSRAVWRRYSTFK